MRPTVIDFETVIVKEDGSQEASTEAYLPNFRVTSMAMSARYLDEIRSDYFVGEDAIRQALQELAAVQAPIIAHNLQFEMLVTKCRFPGIELNWYADTMRLVQNYDNGGRDDQFETIVLEEDAELDGTEDLSEALSKVSGQAEKKVPLSGLGLVKCLKRILPNEYVDHKKEAYDWIEKNVPQAKNKRYGMFLHLLPDDIMRRYNIADTENTLKLYEHCVQKFSEMEYNWRFDHGLFLSSVRMIVDSKIRGVRIDRDRLHNYRVQVEQELLDIAKSFREKFLPQIQDLEEMRRAAWCAVPTTEKGKANRLAKCVPGSKEWEENVEFNVGSNKQLAQLFIDRLGMQPKFHTAKGAPSFKSAMLSQWGPGGEMLKIRRKRLLVLKQVESLIALSDTDGRWHLDLKACGTSTGRFAGGSHG